MIGYKKTEASKDEWLTPPEIVTALGEFDLDPCSPINRPWPTAKQHFTVNDNGLMRDWFGRVWLNPPYDRGVMIQWLMKMAMHGRGVSLIPARTDTDSFHSAVFEHCNSILFVKGRLTFYNVDGSKAAHNSGGPTALVAYSEQDSDALQVSGIAGRHLPVNSIGVIVAGCDYDRSWSVVVRLVMIKLNKAGLDRIYREVESLAPSKVANNQFYKHKIRQQLQHHFRNVSRGVWACENYG